MKIIEITEDISNFANQIENKYELQSFFVSERNDVITLSMIEVPKANRKKGIGSAVMNDLIDYADETQQLIVLTPAVQDKLHGTTSRTRLVKFYKRFGFVENKGRNKDFRLPPGMYRSHK